MKKLATLITTLALFALSAQANETANLMEMVKQLQAQVQQQQAEIESLRADVSSQADITQMVEVAVDERIETEGLGALKEVGSVVSLEDADSLGITGGVVLRYENGQLPDSAAGDEDSKFTTRVRLGLNWQKGDWEAAIGIAGNDGQDGREPEDTTNSGGEWEKESLHLDYFYATHHWDTYSATLGQQFNPYQTSNLFWDSDLRFTGATATADLEAAFLTTGVYDVRYNGVDNDATWLWAIQGGTQFETEGAEGILALGYYHFNNLAQDGASTISWTGSSADLIGDYRLQILDIFGRVEADMGEATVGLFAQYAHNFGADGNGSQASVSDDADDNNDAWAIGAEVQAGQFKVGYAYADIEADALHQDLTDSEFTSYAGNGGTNRKGHIVGVDYEVNSNVTLGAKGYFTEAAEDEGSGDDEGELYQVDVRYRF